MRTESATGRCVGWCCHAAASATQVPIPTRRPWQVEKQPASPPVSSRETRWIGSRPTGMPLAAALELAASRLNAGMRGGNSPQRAGVSPRTLESPSRAPMVSRGLSSQADLDADPPPSPSKAEPRSPELPPTYSEAKHTRVSRRELRILQREQGAETTVDNDSPLRAPGDVPEAGATEEAKRTRVSRRELRILQRDQGAEATVENDSPLRAPAVPGNVPEVGATEKLFPRVMPTSPGAGRRGGASEQGSPRVMPTSPGASRRAGTEQGSPRVVPTSSRVEPDKVAADAPLTPSRGVASLPAAQPQSEQSAPVALGSLEARVASRLSRGTGGTPISMQPVVSASPVSSAGRSPARERTRGEPPAALLQALMRAAARVQGVPTA